jgi:hypothetical protein
MFCDRTITIKVSMAQKDKLTADYLQTLKEIEPSLVAMGFRSDFINEKGFAYFAGYEKKNDTRVEFLFGPSDWDIEMIIYTSKGKFAFKDLLEIIAIRKWVSDNRYKQAQGRDVKKELFWFLDLLKVSLPLVE